MDCIPEKRIIFKGLQILLGYLQSSFVPSESSLTCRASLQCLGAIATQQEVVPINLYGTEETLRSAGLTWNNCVPARNLFVFVSAWLWDWSLFVCMSVCLLDELMVRFPTARHLPTLSNHPPPVLVCSRLPAISKITIPHLPNLTWMHPSCTAFRLIRPVRHLPFWTYGKSLSALFLPHLV